METFVFLLLATIALWNGLGFVFHYYEAMYHPHPSSISVKSYLRAWLWECWYGVVEVLSYPLGWLPMRQRPPFIRTAGPPILLVHGYIMNRACMFALAYRLRRHGYRNVFTVNLKPMFGTIESLAASLNAEIRAISAHCDGIPVYAIGHSMGGLLLRWCDRTEPDLPLAKIICIASPHQGTHLAMVALGANGKQLRRNSALCQALKEMGRTPVISLYSQLDNLVIPASSAAVGSRTIGFDHCGHKAALHDRKIFTAIASELSS